MNKKIKKTLAVTMATASTMAMAMPGVAFAAPGDVPSDAKTVNVSVSNVEGGAEVKAYRIVTPTYNNEGFVKFSNVGGNKIADIEKPTAKEILAIAQAIAAGGTSQYDKAVTLTKSGDTFTGALPAGEYVILVTDEVNAGYVYQPMVASTYYTDANEADSLVAKSVDASGNFVEGEDTIYAKRTTITLDKTILNADGNKGTDDDAATNNNAVSQADDLGVGDTGTFQIATTIPAYTSAYAANGVQYTLTDTQDDGFDAPTNIEVKVNGQKVAAGNDTFKQTITGNDFTLDFASAFAIAHAGEDVVVTYNAKLNANCKQKLDPNNDTVKLTYTNSITDKTKVTEITDDVQEYSFPVQVKKIDEANQDKGLEGAEFTLTRKDGDGKTGTNEYTIATDDTGVATFNRLDEGTYTVKETKAPSGYAINPDEFEIKITPTYGANGKLASYAVDMKNVSQNKAVGSIVIDAADDSIIAGNITDSRLQTLPSTGGAGTKMLILLAAGLAGVTVSLVVIGKKKEQK